MSAVSPLDAGATQRHATGWMASLLAHGGAAGIAVLLATGIQPPPPEPFQWNVSLSEPGSGPTATHTAPAPLSPAASARPAAPSEQAPAPTASPVRMAEAPAVTQPPLATPTPSEPAPARRPTPIEEPQPVIARTTLTPPPAPAAQEPVATVSRTAPVEPAAAAPAAQHSPVPSPSGSLDTRSLAPEPGSAPNAASPASAKRDYGWLAEALWGRIEQLKRYPPAARLNRWEGKVVLRAVIKEDGRIADLKIAQSSGHNVLDQDALGLMQQASPIPLKQPLGHPQVVVHIPISYKLEQ